MTPFSRHRTMNKGELKYPENGKTSAATSFARADYGRCKIPQVNLNTIVFRQNFSHNFCKNRYSVLLMDVHSGPFSPYYDNVNQGCPARRVPAKF